jgi:hypothetical protein
VRGRDAWKRSFVLLMRRPHAPSTESAWDSLLPLEGTVGWISWDKSGEVIVIDPCGGKKVLAKLDTED